MGLLSSVEPCLSSSLKREEKVLIFGYLLAYLFKAINQDGIRVMLKKNNLQEKFDFLKWRRSLHRQGGLLRDTKVFAYSLACSIKTPTSLSIKEKNAVHLAMELPLLTRRLKILSKREDAPFLSIKDLDSKLAECLTSSDLKSYINKFLTKKLGFLMNSFSTPRSDLFSELITAATVSLMKSYPRYEHLGHMIAIAKTAVHNRGINLIEENISKKNSRLLENSNGSYTQTNVPLSEFANDYVPTDSNSASVYSSFLVTGLDGQSQSNWETLFALKQLVNSPKLTPRHRMFLSLMLGEPNAEFSSFLEQNNSDLIDDINFDAYTKKVCNFMKLPMERANSFLGSLRKHL